ncbi:hypothetical protein DFQ30_010637 [Apophysomyces sp. BC1015]|nr:hypothetical protein DFQ30_010637 [Apophysomyces sp. BC1015]KAG0169589.1 hypothetical protein DFQ29_009630 [Apophysomyces sp. BC1021]
MSKPLATQEDREEAERKTQELLNELNELLRETEDDDFHSRVVTFIDEDLHELEDLNTYIDGVVIEAQRGSQSTSNPEAEDLTAVESDEEPEEKISLPELKRTLKMKKTFDLTRSIRRKIQKIDAKMAAVANNQIFYPF